MALRTQGPRERSRAARRAAATRLRRGGTVSTRSFRHRREWLPASTRSSKWAVTASLPDAHPLPMARPGQEASLSRRELRAALATAAALSLVPGSGLVVPAFPAPIACWAPPLVGASSALREPPWTVVERWPRTSLRCPHPHGGRDLVGGFASCTCAVHSS